MAKRSDFAQKLLDDLRLRKERMAASQNTKGSNAMVAGEYFPEISAKNKHGLVMNQRIPTSFQNISQKTLYSTSSRC